MKSSIKNYNETVHDQTFDFLSSWLLLFKYSQITPSSLPPIGTGLIDGCACIECYEESFLEYISWWSHRPGKNNWALMLWTYPIVNLFYGRFEESCQNDADKVVMFCPVFTLGDSTLLGLWYVSKPNSALFSNKMARSL